MIKFLRSVFCLPEPTSKVCDKEDVIRTQGISDVKFEAQGLRRNGIQAVHESGLSSHVIDCSEQKLTLDCVAFQRCEDVHWFRGTFGNRDVAIKKKPKTKRPEVVKEVNLLEKIDHHENVLRYWCHSEDVDNFYIVTDYGIALQQYMYEGTSIQTKNTFQQLCDAVAFLHGLKILLLNIQPNNVRVVEVNGIVRIKLTNFESSYQLEHDEPVVVVGAKVDRFNDFAAPEIKEGATFSSDIYSLGCLFYFVLTKGNVLMLPLSKSHNLRLQDLENGNRNCDTILFVDAIRDMVKYNSNERPNLNKIIEHACFWREHEFFELIMDVCRALENDNSRERKQIRKDIDQNPEYQQKLIGRKRNWKNKIRFDNSKLAYNLYNGSSICELVRFIRNNYAHRTEASMSNTKTELMTDWVEKFPYLMVYLYKVKCMFNLK